MPFRKTPKPLSEADFHHLVREIHRLQGELMAIAQVILDAQARLDTAIAANSAKVDQLIAAGAGGMTAAEQQQVADAIAASAAVVEATNQKS